MPDKNYKDIFPQLLSKVVLCVDDNEMNQLLLTKIMANAGMTFIPVSNGQDAIAKLHEGCNPDFILMDLDMPVLNGLQTCELIRKNFDSNIPIIINSAAISDVQKWKLSRLGITDFLEKPYSMHDIFLKLSAKLQLTAA